VAPAVVAPDLTEAFGIGGTALGILGSAYFYTYAIMQLPSGLLSDSLGPRKAVTIFMLIASSGVILFALSSNLLVAIIGRTLVGLGAGVLLIPALKILTSWFVGEEFVIAAGILMAVGGVGWLLAATPLAVLSIWLGWRMAFMAMAFVSLMLAVLTYIIVRDRPEHLGFPPVNELESDKRSSGSQGVKINLWQGMKMVLSNKYFWPIAVWFFFTNGILFSFGGLWGGPYLMHTYELNKTQAGNILMMIALGTIVGGPLLSFTSEKLLHARKPVLAGSSIILVFIWVVLVSFTHGLSILILHLLFLFIGLFTSGVVVVALTVAKELFPREIAGTSTGTANLFPFLGGAFFQLLVGTTLDKIGRVGSVYPVSAYRLAFALYLVAAIIALTSVWFMKETHSNVSKQKL